MKVRHRVRMDLRVKRELVVLDDLIPIFDELLVVVDELEVGMHAVGEQLLVHLSLLRAWLG